MQVIDTSIWIEILLGSELGKRYLPLLAKPENIIVPTIVQFELFKWLSRERGTEEANRVITFTGECHVQELTTAVAVLAAEVSAQHSLHTTDAVIYASAQLHDCVLLTSDAHFKDVADVEFVDKAG